jgi:hypothetical protein
MISRERRTQREKRTQRMKDEMNEDPESNRTRGTATDKDDE